MTNEKAHIRRRPEQARSKASVQVILNAATELIGLHGADAVSMTDIANQAGVSKAALYRYFPNRQSIIRELAVVEYHRNQDSILATSHLSEEPADVMTRGLKEYCRRQAEPYRLQLRAAIHADSELATMDLADSRANAAAITDIMLQRGVSIDRAVLEQRLLLILELLDSIIRTMTRVDSDEAEGLLDQFTSMAMRHILATE